MIHYQELKSGIVEANADIDYQEPSEIFGKLYKDYSQKFLFESKDISPIYGRMSLMGLDPVLEISGKGNEFVIKNLNQRSSFYLDQISRKDFEICDFFKKKEGQIIGKIEKDQVNFEEEERSKRKNIAQVIRILLEKFKMDKKAFLGLYGAFSYDFIRLFEDIGVKNPQNDIQDFRLFLYDTFIFVDHVKQKSEIVVFRDNKAEAEKSILKLKYQMVEKELIEPEYEIKDADFGLEKSEYEDLVKKARDLARQGELFEVVFSNVLKAKFEGEAYALYLKYRDANPSPYLYYFDFGDEQLVGASPEMMVRCENGVANLRPISGTAARGKDPIEDHENMLELLANPKERAELDMLVDLGRNDLSRVCEPGIEISDYRFVEKYSKVMHTVAHVSGHLRKDCTSLDALIACLNAGTLTGAPKVAAMQTIEKNEKERRGYYGGTIGYLTFGGDLDSGIIIRTAHIRDGELRFQVGATLLYDSDPEKEYFETLHKAEAFLTTFANQYTDEI